MRPDGIIFDFDGVVVDTEPIHHRAFQVVLEPLGLGFSWEAYQEVFMGFDDRDAFREAFRRSERPLTDQMLHELIAAKAKSFDEIIESGVMPYPGVLELIKSSQAAGIPLAICSGALRSDILPILNQLEVTDCFSVIVTAEDVPQSKPDPTCYRIAAQELRATGGLSSDQLLCAIEDTPAGIQAAQGAGLKVIGVTNSYPAETISQADRVVDSLVPLIGDQWF